MEIALLDLEGVLVDTAAARRDAVLRALHDAGVPPPPDLDAALVAGTPGLAIAAAFAAARARHPDAGDRLDETAAELAELRAERHVGERLAGGLALAPGARDAVEALGRRLRLGVVTRLRRRDAGFVLELAGLEPAFAVVVTADDVRAVAPAPDAHARALARLARRRSAADASPSAAAIAIEASAAGVAAARAAGLRVLGVGPGATAGDAWVPAIAGLTYDSLSALLHPAPDRDR